MTWKTTIFSYHSASMTLESFWMNESHQRKFRSETYYADYEISRQWHTQEGVRTPHWHVKISKNILTTFSLCSAEPAWGWSDCHIHGLAGLNVCNLSTHTQIASQSNPLLKQPSALPLSVPQPQGQVSSLYLCIIQCHRCRQCNNCQSPWLINSRTTGPATTSPPHRIWKLRFPASASLLNFPILDCVRMSLTSCSLQHCWWQLLFCLR